MYHEKDTTKTCAVCRWCYAGRECRFFDTERDRAQYTNPEKCPFFEDRAIDKRLADIAAALLEIADRVGWLQ